jgi:nitroreductase
MQDMPARTAAFLARYGAEASPPPEGPWNAVLASLLHHRSVRAYKPDPVPPGTLETLVAAAQSAATSSNMQTWSVVVVSDPATKAALARIAGGQKHIEQCPLFLVWVADLSRLARVGDAAGATLEGLPYLETFLVAAMDAAIASQNAIVAAESMGLSTVYIGALRNDMAEVARLLGLPPGAAGVVGLCVGYEDESRPSGVKPRLPQSVVLHHEHYDTSAEADGRAAYDRAMEGFSQSVERSKYSWTERVIGRMGRVSALAGRDKLRDVLVGLGFPLR